MKKTERVEKVTGVIKDAGQDGYEYRVVISETNPGRSFNHKSIGLRVTVPEGGDIDAFITNIQKVRPDYFQKHEEQIRATRSYAVIIGSGEHPELHPATMRDPMKAVAAWETNWEILGNAGIHPGKAAKDRIVELSKVATKNINGGSWAIGA